METAARETPSWLMNFVRNEGVLDSLRSQCSATAAEIKGLPDKDPGVSVNGVVGKNIPLEKLVLLKPPHASSVTARDTTAHSVTRRAQPAVHRGLLSTVWRHPSRQHSSMVSHQMTNTPGSFKFV